MHDSLTGHYAQLLGLKDDWRVDAVQLELEHKRVTIALEFVGRQASCPECGVASPLYDQAAERTWRHLDTMQFETRLRRSKLCIEDSGISRDSSAVVPAADDRESAPIGVQPEPHRWPAHSHADQRGLGGRHHIHPVVDEDIERPVRVSRGSDGSGSRSSRNGSSPE